MASARGTADSGPVAAASMATQILAELGHRSGPHNKRPRPRTGLDEESDPMGPGPSPQRARVDPEREEDADEATAADEQTFTSLDTAYDKALVTRLQDMRRRPASHACFFCDSGDYNHDATADDGCDALVIMTNYYLANWGLGDEWSTCREIARLDVVHRTGPARRANGGVLPEHMVPLTPEMVMVHFSDHVMDPIATDVFCMRLNKQVALAASRKIEVEGALDDKAMNAVIKATGQLYAMNREYRKTYGRGDTVALDPAKVMSRANMRRIEQLRMQSANALGGATATDTSAAAARVQRPMMGAAVSLEPDSEASAGFV